MGLAFSIAVYFIIWWLVLFLILPIGLRTQEEEGEVLPGTPESAPATLAIWKKFLITTIASAIVFAGVYVVITYRLIDLDSVAIY